MGVDQQDGVGIPNNANLESASDDEGSGEMVSAPLKPGEASAAIGAAMNDGKPGVFVDGFDTLPEINPKPALPVKPEGEPEGEPEGQPEGQPTATPFTPLAQSVTPAFTPSGPGLFGKQKKPDPLFKDVAPEPEAAAAVPPAAAAVPPAAAVAIPPPPAFPPPPPPVPMPPDDFIERAEAADMPGVRMPPFGLKKKRKPTKRKRKRKPTKRKRKFTRAQTLRKQITKKARELKSLRKKLSKSKRRSKKLSKRDRKRLTKQMNEIKRRLN